MDLIKRVNSARSLQTEPDRPSRLQSKRGSEKPTTPTTKNAVKPRALKTLLPQGKDATTGKENKMVTQNLSKSRQLTCMDKQIKMALNALKESAPANSERTMVIRRALHEKYTLSRSNSSCCLSKNASQVKETSGQKQRRLSLLHPAAMRRNVSPSAILKPQLSALIAHTQSQEIMGETRRSLTPEGYDDIADELEDYHPEHGNFSPERTSNVKKSSRAKVFDQAYLSPSEVQAEFQTQHPTESLFSDPVKETPVLLRKRRGREIVPHIVHASQIDLIDEDESDSVAEFLKTENFAMTRDRVHASRMHVLNNTKPITPQSTFGSQLMTQVGNMMSNASLQSTMKPGLSHFRQTLATYTSPFDHQPTGSDNEGSTLRLNRSEFRQTLMPQAQVKPFEATKKFDRASGRSIALALKCAQLEGILKLSCCQAIKRLAYIECTLKKQALKKLQAHAKSRYIEYESLATSFVDGRASLKSLSYIVMQSSLIREDDNE